MRYNIDLAPETIEQLRDLDAHVRAEIRDGIERHLRYEPTKTSKSRIKQLKELTSPQYRLRIGDMRVFYDVESDRVNVLAILPKTEAIKWLKLLTKEMKKPD
ncbi:MAG: type II toxin-antitoxin system RelE/ParE family toxin [Acidobacteria bacterium]|nr:type II toxin-antitoxin system RelE/ParE family toxin [Acidobacteriota bacterium]